MQGTCIAAACRREIRAVLFNGLPVNALPPLFACHFPGTKPGIPAALHRQELIP